MITSQKINEYYSRYKSIDVTLSKEIAQATGLVANQIFLKCVSDFWPCVIYSTSFEGAKVLVSIKSGILQKLEQANNMVSLRFCFKTAEKGNPVTFFVNTKAAGNAPYGGSQDMAMFTLQFTQRPPDDLIEIMGRILDANVNSQRRREEKITISPETVRKLRLAAKETAVLIQGLPRQCILREISFTWAKIIMQGVAKFLVEKDAILRVEFEDPREPFLLRGKFSSSEEIEGRKDLVALVLSFDENTIPMSYKIRINDYLSVVRADDRSVERPQTSRDDPFEKKKAPDAAPAPSSP
ncbi:MAG: pilus assembly protein PilZ [Treponema sp.]|nr:pilus assembly protein PilZ [Treponema sp.]